MPGSPTYNAASPADKALRSILRQQLGAVRANGASLGSLSDTRPLHDWRVAVRRSRVALRMLRQALPNNTYTQLRDELKWLARSTNASRDLDVQLVAIKAYCTQLPLADRQALKPLLTDLNSDRKQELRQLRALVKSERYAELLTDWQASLTTAPQANKRPDRPILQVSNGQIKKQYQRVLRDATALHKRLKPETLHDLRITAKKLRYALEFFRPLYPAELIENCIRELKALQDELGDFHDLTLLLDMLQRYRKQLIAERTVTTSTRAALDHLIATSTARQSQTQKDARRALARIAQARSRAAYKRLWHTKYNSAAKP